jgi:formamidopyrimidine-DNA glycosylase
MRIIVVLAPCTYGPLRLPLKKRPLKGAGPDALTSGLNPTEIFKGGRTIKDVLLDQSLIAGLGNIYACEALYKASIDPWRRCPTLTLEDRNRLLRELQELLANAVSAGGATLDDYRGTEGEVGTFDTQFAVYGRDGKRCPNCECSGTVLRRKQSARSTWYCPIKQT